MGQMDSGQNNAWFCELKDVKNQAKMYCVQLRLSADSQAS